MKRLIAVALLLTLALPAAANDWIPCHSLDLEDGQVVGENGDSETLTWSQDGSTITWNVGVAEVEDWMVQVTACEDGTIFLAGASAELGEGPEYAETVSPTTVPEATTTTVVEVQTVAVVAEPVVLRLPREKLRR